MFKTEIKSLSDIKSKILVPVKGKTEWLNPLYHPIYLDIEDIRELFPHAQFLDLRRLVDSDVDDAKWKRFLKKINIWDKAALYLDTYQLDARDSRNNDFEQYTGKSSKPFTVTNDRCLDIPVKFNKFFFDKVINHWDEYVAYIEDPDLPTLSCRSYYSDYSDSVKELKRIFPNERRNIDMFFAFILKKNFIEIYTKIKNITFKELLDCYFQDFRGY